jgi:hypothetical protein
MNSCHMLATLDFFLWRNEERNRQVLIDLKLFWDENAENYPSLTRFKFNLWL